MGTWRGISGEVKGLGEATDAILPDRSQTLETPYLWKAPRTKSPLVREASLPPIQRHERADNRFDVAAESNGRRSELIGHRPAPDWRNGNTILVERSTSVPLLA
jgi:hypothetical protein